MLMFQMNFGKNKTPNQINVYLWVMVNFLEVKVIEYLIHLFTCVHQ
jgi:hypothetical protein